ncbi:aldehyde dehydrogenase family protein [Streptomyces sp. SS1-1]|nr:aldehyde dehydrogenase family protein [Streptomyces sp. SS1-1]
MTGRQIEVGRSGVGRDVGSYALHAYSEVQSIVRPG